MTMGASPTLTNPGVRRRRTPAGDRLLWSAPRPRICLLMHPSRLRDVLKDIFNLKHDCDESAPRLDGLGEAIWPTPDLIVVDLGSGPSMDDQLDVVRALRADPVLAHVPVLATTTDLYAARHRRRELKDLRTRVLALPFDLVTIDARVASLVYARPAVR